MGTVMGRYREGWSRYAEFRGRTSPGGFWAFVGINMGILIGAAILFDSVSGRETTNGGSDAVGAWLLVAFALAAMIPTIAVGTRRFRDAGLSQWFWLLVIAPFGTVALVVLWSLPSKVTTEVHYGTPPAGWYVDSVDAACLRWWDGYEWTLHTMPRPEAAEPLVEPASRPDREGEWTAPS